MRLFLKKIIIASSIILIVMVGVFNVSYTFADDTIITQKLLGIWWTHDADEVPWAIQFKEDGTFSSAHTYLRLEKLPVDEGRFQLKGTSLTLISNKDCAGSCKGLKGTYEVGFSEYGQLILKEQKDPCLERKEVYDKRWIKALHCN
jgi:hypothetical protein